MTVYRLLERIWYERNFLFLPLVPISWLYCILVVLRRLAYRVGFLPRKEATVPVIIVGNITAGGTGKTPLVIWLCKFLQGKGFKPGVISTGYGGKRISRPQQVRPDSDPFTVGDEPVLIAGRADCPVAVFHDRYQAAMELLTHSDCNILICDDGLQDLSFDRDLEIAVMDGDRRFGNGYCFPAGPLREPPDRLDRVDLVVSKGNAGKNEHLMRYVYGNPLPLRPGPGVSIDRYRDKRVHVVTAIANPSRFIDYLRKQGICPIEHIYPDHHPLTRADILFEDGLPVLMTEKDAVKCRLFAVEDTWYIPITAKLNDIFMHRLNCLLKDIING